MLHIEKWEGLSSHTILYHNDTKTSHHKIVSKASCCRLRTYFTHSINCQPYLTPIMNNSALNFIELLLPHAQFHPSTTLHVDKLGNMTTSPDPSTFQHATLKPVNAPGDKASFTVQVVAD